MRVPSFRILALLLVLAGGSLGLFAGSLLAGSPGPTTTRPTDPYVDAQVTEYTTRFGLDAAGAGRVRHEFEQLRGRVRAKRMEILARHQDELDALVEETGERIRRIVREHGTPGAGTEADGTR
jgi:hypothetical protein